MTMKILVTISILFENTLKIPRLGLMLLGPELESFLVGRRKEPGEALALPRQ